MTAVGVCLSPLPLALLHALCGLRRAEETLDLFSSETLLLILVDIYYYLTSLNRPVMGTILLHEMSSCAVCYVSIYHTIYCHMHVNIIHVPCEYTVLMGHFPNGNNTLSNQNEIISIKARNN